MRALFSGSTTSPATAPTPTTTTTTTATPTGSPPPPPPLPRTTATKVTGNTGATAANAYTSPTPAVSVSPPDASLPRSVRSRGSSQYDDDDDDDTVDQTQLQTPDSLDKTLVRPSFLRRLSPGLAARVKQLDGSHKSANASGRNSSTIGRIPQEQIKELDSLHQNYSIKVEKKGRSWNGPLGQDQQQEDHLDETAESTTAEMSLAADATPAAEPEDGQTDFEKYLQSTEQNEARPSAAAKDSPPPTSSAASSSSHNPWGLHRTESIYSFSRASFSNQLSQLTSIGLPQPAALESSITQIPNAPKAVRALTGASEQIQIWIRKASDVLSGMDAEDDVEWAAAGGREGLDGMDNAINRFGGLVDVYVKAIEDVQMRDDIGDVGPQNLQMVVVQMESVLQSWQQIKQRLHNVKQQVELAMEWEELWGTVFGDVGMEVDHLSQLIFEMEEKRHWTLAGADQESSHGLDINELETIVEETPANRNGMSTKRFSSGPLYHAAPTLDTPLIQTPQDDDTNHSNLMALFARMQPLRASLEFLPMRLSMFVSRAESMFPSACEELEDRRTELERNYKTLESDAEAVRKELGEDRWILVFRNAGHQAQKMFESVERSIGKLQEGLEGGAHLHDPAGLSKRVESYEGKKLHYVPALERVVTIVQKGVRDRLTVNGETLRLLADMKSRTNALKASIKVMDESLEDVDFAKTQQQLRDSISSIVTMESPATNSVSDTPGSSPASSVILSGHSTTPLGSSSRRGSSVGSAARSTLSKVRRISGLPQPTLSATSKKSAIPKPPSITAPSPKPTYTPTPASRRASSALHPSSSSTSPLTHRPRWNGSTNTADLDTGHNSYYKARSANLFRKSAGPGSTRPSSTVPFSSARRDLSASPAPPTTRSGSRFSQASRSPARAASPSPRSILDPPPYSKLRKPSALPPAGVQNTPRSRQSFAGTSSFSRSVSREPETVKHSRPERPGTALGHSQNKRTSLLPLPKPRSGRESAAASRSKLDERPPWR